jgi:hypothetical protein
MNGPENREKTGLKNREKTGLKNGPQLNGNIDIQGV